TGDVLGALAEDVERLQDIYLRTVFPAVTALVMYGGAVVAFGSVDLGFALWMGLYMLFLVAVLPAISLRVTWKLRRVDEPLNLYVGRERQKDRQILFGSDYGNGRAGVIC
ncbi:hypothetical protein PC115_g25646, partial [Phytophthora cactorum]